MGPLTEEALKVLTQMRDMCLHHPMLKGEGAFVDAELRYVPPEYRRGPVGWVCKFLICVPLSIASTRIISGFNSTPEWGMLRRQAGAYGFRIEVVEWTDLNYPDP